MPRVIEKTIFKFEELEDERAKQRARDWYRQGSGPEDFEYTTDDAVTIGELMGIEFDTRTVQLYGGGTRGEPKVYWSVSHGQGDYAAFEGRYSYRKGAAKLVRAHAPVDKELHRIVDELQAVQRRNFYRLRARCQENRGNQSVEVEDSEHMYRDIGEAEGDIREALKDFAHWIYCQLRDEDEYRNSDEAVDESLICNEYEFDEEGRRA